MCCFSGTVDVVADTKIFARDSKDDKQYLGYSMLFSSAEDIAMILPIPTPKGSAEDAVRFINLKEYENFFDDMWSGFPILKNGRGGKDGDGKNLAVIEVGDYIASFVPSVKDFDRLDKQFRLPEAVWEKLPQYKNWGFAVFKLKKPEKGQRKVHPMAFEFPRIDKKVLFFPTVHIHNGTVPAKAGFDHALFCQVTGDAPMNWTESEQLAEQFMKVKKTEGIVDPDAHVYRKLMKGSYDNKDILV